MKKRKNDTWTKSASKNMCGKSVLCGRKIVEIFQIFKVFIKTAVIEVEKKVFDDIED